MTLKMTLVLAAFTVFTVACAQPAANSGAANSNVAQTNSPANAAALPTSPVKTDAARGEDLYTVNCMTCHKDNGKGGKATVDGKTLDVEDLTTEKKKQRTDEKLAQDISEGAESDGMPAFKDKLTPDQIKMVVAHLRTLQSK